MSRFLRKIILFLAFLLPAAGFATHIVGGVLNYSYNGGNIYTITLRLFRDCGKNTAAFPNNITIYVKGNNGANFSPSKNITIPLGSVTSVTAPTDPCAIPPNPMPCVQQGVYTRTISLPPNNGGYHLYYQLEARNLSLTNINSSCNCIGETFYAYVPNYTVNVNGNSNAVFNSFPPLFLCVNQGFSINHSATDADGDSLVYSLYAPYNGDNGNGPLDPTFSNNVANFTPVNYLNGFTANNPLGASPFSINPVTGILTGTPGLVGQFVVGVRVREYRNGVYISETIRDFQFNVLNCPAPPPQLAVGNQTINHGCSKVVTATGLAQNTTTWTSISPGVQGAYNHFLSCTFNCLTTSVVPTGTPPSYVDYVVCGVQTNCKNEYVCDTFRVHFQPPLAVTIGPLNPALCNGQTNTTITAIGSGGTPPYSFLWNNVNPSQSISVGVGTYNVKLSDASGCPPAYASAVITSYSVPVAINAGSDATRCSANPLTAHTATISGASGCIWSGGTGTFSPNNTSSSIFYTPSPAELAGGSATLIVTTTGSGFCPPDSDTVVVSYSNFTGTVVATTTPVTCYGLSTGAASLSVTGGQVPHSYTWQVSPSVTGPLLSNKPIGTYSYVLTDNIGCTKSGSVTITQPPPLAMSRTVTNASCFGSANGSGSVTAAGGTSPYSYSWTPVSQTGSVATSLAAGSYSCILTDANGCTTTSIVTITQPTSVTVVSAQTNIACFSASTGVITTTVSGGTGPYSYSWNPGGQTTSGLNGIPAGNYVFLVSDQRSCTATTTVTITQPASLSIALSATNEVCNYLDNGIVSVNANGGTPSYSYSWTPGASTASLVSGLTAGTYSVKVTDANNCSVTGTVSVSQPPILSVSLVNYSPVRCFGGSDGSVTAVTNGGTAGYNYSWAPGGITTASLANRPAGSYSITVTDANSCTATAVQVISEPSPLVQSAIVNSVSCAGGNNAAITLSVSGGTGPYQHLWLPGGQATATLTPATAGIYTAVTTDANNCTVAATYTVSEPQPITITFTPTAVLCAGGANGAVTSSVTGGHAPYSYSWSTAASTKDISGVVAGIYTVTVSDNLNCVVTRTVEVTEPDPLAVAISATNETCDYSNDGIAQAQMTGGIAPYIFNWQPGGATTNSITGLSAGSYTVLVTDANACTASLQTIIGEPDPLSPVLSFTAVSCFAGNDGVATVSVTGGTPNYQYTFSPSGSTLSTAPNLSAGVHTVSVTDSKGCAAQATVNVLQPTAITATEIVTDVSCFNGNNGSVSVTPSGGTAPYSYFWNPGGNTTALAGGLTAGNYTVMITDANNCVHTRTYAISEPADLTLSMSFTATSCYNGTNGVAQASASGGTAPYTYSWAHGPGTSTANNLSAGIYTVTVTDNLLCTATATVEVTEPTQLVPSTTFTNESCDYLNDGAASVSASGGTPSYTFTWLPGTINGTVNTGLAAGVYTVITTDAQLCTAQTTVEITQPLPLSVTITQTIDVSCSGLSDGQALAVAGGGTPNYMFTWTSGSTNTAFNGSLTAGTHTVSVTDANGCLETGTVTINEPLPLTISAITSQVQCAGGTNGAISLSINGGTPSYSNVIMPGNVSGTNFSGLPAGNYTVYSTDANGCSTSNTVTVDQALSLSTVTSFTNPSCGQPNGMASIAVSSGGVPPFTYSWIPSGGTSSVATGLNAGSYTVQVTDANGCISTKFIDIADAGAPVVAIASVTDVSCYGGTDGAVSANVSGGTAPLTFSWSPSGGSTANAVNLPSGYYSLVVTDALGCIGVVTSSLVAQPAELSSVVTTTAVSCNSGADGRASVQVAGGTPGYTYTWQSGVPSANNVNGLTAGSYSVLITDTKLCTHTATFSISEPPVLSLAVDSKSVSCFSGTNGVATGTASGGTPPYSYNWLSGNVTTQTVQNLPAGIYTLTAVDNKSCSISSTVEIIEPTQIALTGNTKNSDCSLPNGEATVTATGGNSGYSYQWSPSGATNSIATSISAGVHTVVVTDINLCVATITVSVADNPAPAVAITNATNVSCFNGFDGAAEVNVTGGTGPFTYTWSPTGGNASTATGLPAGQYTVLVLSANNCTVNAVSPIITQPPPVILFVSTSSVLCKGDNTGSATVTAFGGTGAYTYSWQSGVASGNSVSGLSQGIFTVEVRDANNCFAVGTFTINEPQQQLALSITSTSVLCAGGTNGSATLSPTGGTSPYNILWTPGMMSGPIIKNLAAGVYTADVTDLNGCTIQQTLSIDEPAAISLTTNALPSNCSAANGQASVTAGGGMPPYSYQWSPTGGNSAVTSSILAGSYSVTVVDSNTCSATATVAVTDLPAPIVSIVGVSSVSCYGGANGTASAQVTGGSGPFNFQWSSGVGTTSVVTTLPAGQHTVIVTAANACTATAVTMQVFEPSPLAVQFLTTAVNCFAGNNGSVAASVFGGTTPYNYSWAPVASASNSLQSIPAGIYSLTVTDGNSCVRTWTVEITEPSNALSLSVSASSVLCFGEPTGSATVNAAGGTSPYSFNWSPAAATGSVAVSLIAGIYTVNAIDAKGCTEQSTVSIGEPAQPLTLTVTSANAACFATSTGAATVVAGGGTPIYTYSWSPAASTNPVVTGLAAGNYSVRVIDQNLCDATATLEITEPTLLTGTLLAVHPSCERSNGILNAQLSGGTGPFTYQWNAGSSLGPTNSGLAAGNYSLLATDANNCQLPLTATLINIPGPTVTVVSADAVTCFGLANGAATVATSGVSPPFSHQWIPTGGNATTASNLPAGVYTVIATDSLGCSAVAITTVQQPAQLNIGLDSLNNVSCFGQSDGAAFASAYGGTAPYTYSWSTGSSSSISDSLPSGTYSVFVTDQNNCSFSLTTIISEPPVLTATAGITRQILCFAGTGDASVTINGGTAPYSVNWTSNPPQTGDALIGVPFGGYIVTVTDENGCETADTITFAQPSQIATAVTQIDTICAGSNSLLTASAQGGSGDYTFNWAPVGTVNTGSLQITPANDITYTVVAFDENGCAGSDAVSIVNVYELDDSDFELASYSPICPGQTSVLEAQVVGNTGVLSYTWSHGIPANAGPHMVQPSTATIYTVSISNECGVVVSKTTTVEIADPPVALLAADSLRVCAPGAIQFREIGEHINTADPVVEWTWAFSNGEVSAEQDPLFYFDSPGTYSVHLTVTSDRGCVGTSTAPLSFIILPQPDAAFVLSDTVLQLPYDELECTNLSTGATNFKWDFGDGTTSTLANPRVRLQTVGENVIRLIAISEFGCSDTAIKIIRSSSQLVFPNAFTPNENGPSGGLYDVTSLNNDVFFPYTSGVTDYNLQVFNRWGELIFESTEVRIGWDGYYRGVLCQQGVYVWKASATLGDGKKFTQSGTLTLLRK